tara:strand:- start:225 stop:476 length:252 start_codon:yes stop_codon:yes gene_type:complete
LKVEDLDTAYKHVLQGNNWNELTNLRKHTPGDKSSRPTELTNIDLKLSAREFAAMISKAGYVSEGKNVLAFLNGIGTFDKTTK